MPRPDSYEQPLGLAAPALAEPVLSVTVHLGACLFPDHATWEQMRDAALLVDELGYDSVWTWDHFMPLRGDTDGPLFEGWQILAAWGAVTRRIRIGTLVTGNTYRHPAVVAKMVTTLDHITNGRAIMGLGAAWHEREHKMHGIAFDTPGVRLAKMDEAAQIIRSLLDKPRTTFKGKHYTITEALAEPKPIQRKLPLLIGGGGERKTLRSTAKYADMWHGFGTPEEIGRKIEVLRKHCADVGRDPAEILPTCGIQPGVCLRDSDAAVDEWRWTVARTARMTELPPLRPLRSVEDVAQKLLAYWKVGVRGFILGLGAPFDPVTLERLAREVKPRFLELVA